jgi:translocation and assembly module TamB
VTDDDPKPAPAGADGPMRATGRHRRRRRIARGVGVALLAILIVLGGGLGWLLWTSSGLRFAADQARSWLPDTLALEAVDGRLAGPLEITGVRVTTAGARVRIDRLELAWSPAALFAAKLQVDQLAVSGVDVELESTQAPAAEADAGGPALPDELGLPLTVALADIAVDDVAITRPSGAVQRIARLRLAGRAGPAGVDLDHLRVVAPQGRLEARLTLAGEQPYALDGRLDWRWQAPDLPPLAGRAQLDGTLRDLRLVHELTAPTAATVKARLRLFGADPRWQADVDLPTTRPRDWFEAAPALSAQAYLQLAGTLERAEVQGSFEVAEVPGGPLRGHLDVAADGQRVRVRGLEVEPVAPAEAGATGST